MGTGYQVGTGTWANSDDGQIKDSETPLVIYGSGKSGSPSPFPMRSQPKGQVHRPAMIIGTKETLIMLPGPGAGLCLIPPCLLELWARICQAVVLPQPG